LTQESLTRTRRALAPTSSRRRPDNAAMRTTMLGRRGYGGVEAAMRDFTHARTTATEDELWLVEHEPVFTLGVAGRDEHVLDAGPIAVVRTDRGGQATYHGPGQVVAYPLVDLRRLRIYVKEYVYRLEQAVIDVLAQYEITGHRVAGAPGIYVRLGDPSAHARLDANASDRFAGLGKVAALGIKVSNHCCYHGVALNVAMDLQPFTRINPCGYAGLATVDLATLGVKAGWSGVAERLGARLTALLST
jgi:lipoyl(octanoyl) transferase